MDVIMTPIPLGRPPTCDCGACAKCGHRTYMRERYQRLSLDERRAIVAARDPEAQARSDRKRSGTPRRRASLARNTRVMRERHPERYRANTAVSNAVRDGRLTKEPCSECGEPKVHAHHPRGYDEAHRLDVVWLCGPHHRAVHREPF